MNWKERYHIIKDPSLLEIGVIYKTDIDNHIYWLKILKIGTNGIRSNFYKDKYCQDKCATNVGYSFKDIPIRFNLTIEE